MFSVAQIVGLAVLTLVIVAVALILMRVDSAIVTAQLAEEDESGSDVAAASAPRPPLPASGKKLPRSKRKGRS